MLLTLIVLRAASLKVRFWAFRAPTVRVLKEPFSPENLVAESSVAAKELMLTKVSTNTASLTIRELMLMEEAEAFWTLSSLALKELTKT